MICLIEGYFDIRKCIELLKFHSCNYQFFYLFLSKLILGTKTFYKVKSINSYTLGDNYLHLINNILKLQIRKSFYPTADLKIFFRSAKYLLNSHFHIFIFLAPIFSKFSFIEMLIHDNNDNINHFGLHKTNFDRNC